MAVYSVIAGSHRNLLKNAIEAHFDRSNFMEVSNGFWLINSQLPTPKELSLLLAPNNDAGTFFVTPVTGYYGYHNNSVWNWLSAKGI